MATAGTAQAAATRPPPLELATAPGPDPPLPLRWSPNAPPTQRAAARSHAGSFVLPSAFMAYGPADAVVSTTDGAPVPLTSSNGGGGGGTSGSAASPGPGPSLQPSASATGLHSAGSKTRPSNTCSRRASVLDPPHPEDLIELLGRAHNDSCPLSEELREGTEVHARSFTSSSVVGASAPLNRSMLPAPPSLAWNSEQLRRQQRQPQHSASVIAAEAALLSACKAASWRRMTMSGASTTGFGGGGAAAAGAGGGGDHYASAGARGRHSVNPRRVSLPGWRLGDQAPLRSCASAARLGGDMDSPGCLAPTAASHPSAAWEPCRRALVAAVLPQAQVLPAAAALPDTKGAGGSGSSGGAGAASHGANNNNTPGTASHCLSTHQSGDSTTSAIAMGGIAAARSTSQSRVARRGQSLLGTARSSYDRASSAEESYGPAAQLPHAHSSSTAESSSLQRNWSRLYACTTAAAVATAETPGAVQAPWQLRLSESVPPHVQREECGAQHDAAEFAAAAAGNGAGRLDDTASHASLVDAAADHPAAAGGSAARTAASVDDALSALSAERKGVRWAPCSTDQHQAQHLDSADCTSAIASDSNVSDVRGSGSRVSGSGAARPPLTFESTPDLRSSTDLAMLPASAKEQQQQKQQRQQEVPRLVHDQDSEQRRDAGSTTRVAIVIQPGAEPAPSTEGRALPAAGVRHSPTKRSGRLPLAASAGRQSSASPLVTTEDLAAMLSPRLSAPWRGELSQLVQETSVTHSQGSASPPLAS